MTDAPDPLADVEAEIENIRESVAFALEIVDTLAPHEAGFVRNMKQALDVYDDAKRRDEEA